MKIVISFQGREIKNFVDAISFIMSSKLYHLNMPKGDEQSLFGWQIKIE